LRVADFCMKYSPVVVVRGFEAMLSREITPES